jgi:3-methyladenine DNA glycosylase AlkD
VLRRLARSRLLWDRRIAALATFYFIRHGRPEQAERVVRLLMDDEHDLVHKACGWMLREVGKIDRPRLERFLQRHGRRLPRTTLRYAIERFPPRQRARYLTSRVRI